MIAEWLMPACGRPVPADSVATACFLPLSSCHAFLSDVRSLHSLPSPAGNHAFESIDACFRHVQDPKLQAVMWLQVSVGF